MREIHFHSLFKRDYKRIQKRHYPLKELKAVIDLLQQDIPLPPRYKDHALKGDYAGFRDCHIRPDWLLIYRLHENELILTLTLTGTHADLFDL